MMPRIAVKMKPCGPLSPGVTALAISPATKPIIMVQIKCIMFSLLFGSKFHQIDVEADERSSVAHLGTARAYITAMAHKGYGAGKRHNLGL